MSPANPAAALLVMSTVGFVSCGPDSYAEEAWRDPVRDALTKLQTDYRALRESLRRSTSTASEPNLVRALAAKVEERSRRVDEVLATMNARDALQSDLRSQLSILRRRFDELQTEARQFTKQPAPDEEERDR